MGESALVVAERRLLRSRRWRRFSTCRGAYEATQLLA
jgi:hypothetical protein